MKELISVIVPVYNVEQYLQKCIETIINQTYKNIEIILVDDGSNDLSSAICDQLALQDKRIVVFHKQNGGLSDARNYGIDRIKGQWMTFIDSDDYIATTYIEELYNCAIAYKADISICDPVHIFHPEENVEFQSASKTKVFNKTEAIKIMWYQTGFLPSAWGKLYKAEVFKQVRFTKDVIFEDIDIMHEVFYKANTIVYTNAKLYAYQHRENSITTQAFSQKDLYIQNICEKIRKFAKENDKKLVNASIAYSVVGMMRVFINTPREPQFIENINASRLYIQNNGMRILKDRNVRKKTKIAIILFFVSKKLLFFVHSKINRWR